MTGIEELRKAVRLFNMCSETINERFTPPQLLRIAAACRACTHDYLPDQWSDEQLQAAADHGTVPVFEDDE